MLRIVTGDTNTFEGVALNAELEDAAELEIDNILSRYVFATTLKSNRPRLLLRL